MTVVVSNRGPYGFVARPDGGYDVKPGAGGVASALGPLLTSGAAGPGAAWIAAAISDDDRRAWRDGATSTPGIALTLLDVDAHEYRRYYDVVANGTLTVGYRMKATLSIDHRVADGAMGARFLQTLKRLLENPLLMA